MPKVDRVLDAVRATDWTRWDVPWESQIFEYRPEAVVPAFEALAMVGTEEDAKRVYDQILNAIAHNHSGTPYPAIVEGARHLVAMIPLLEGWALQAATSALIECYLWTADSVDARTVDGASHDLTEVHSIAATVSPLLQRVAVDSRQPAQRAAGDLLDTIRDIPPEPNPMSEIGAQALRRR